MSTRIDGRIACWKRRIAAAAVVLSITATQVAVGQQAASEEPQSNEAAVATEDATDSQNQNASSSSADAAAQPPAAEQQSETAQSIQADVEQQTRQQAAEEKESLINEAVEAVALTRQALEQLDAGKNDEAFDTLAKVAGKLELAIARNPGVAFLPVEVSTTVYDVIAQVETVEEYIKQARKALDKGQVQVARRILSGLASEVVVSTTKLPVATYPLAIKKVAPLIDAGKIEEAKRQLQTALNLLVVSDTVFPLPVLRSNLLLEEAETLAEKTDRSPEENERLEKLLAETEHQIALGRALGYLDAERTKDLRSELKQIREKTSGGQAGKGFFDRINALFENWGEWLGD
ncbi:MAG: hypothetical protein KatS3mg111_3949 [Pirellulaceae bacterium]|nr:MAG: hypothetical protein KatS3mg111_3949 [Pirellulaceae bacterium]